VQPLRRRTRTRYGGRVGPRQSAGEAPARSSRIRSLISLAMLKLGGLCGRLPGSHRYVIRGSVSSSPLAGGGAWCDAALGCSSRGHYRCTTAGPGKPPIAGLSEKGEVAAPWCAATSI
jgi:hypothetical protein